MKKTGLIKALLLSAKYEKMDEADREEIRKERLLNIVEFAKENSPYFKNLYQDIGCDFKLSDLPPTNKVELMQHFDEWLTERSVKLSDIMEFMEDPDNIGRWFKGKYLVFTTSGSTGNPSVVLCDKQTNNVMGAINSRRSIAHKEDLREFIRRGAKTIGIFATGGFYLGNSSVRARLLKMPWKKKQMAITSALLPIEQIVAELNTFQPVMLGGYPTILELLINEQESGRLHISPAFIMTGGEVLSSQLREQLQKTFNCHAQTSYSCTEGGTIACECRQQHFHINDDWVIIEAVDKNGNPVADNIQSDRIFLTNLFNYTQPFIRYEITDRVTIHSEPCACGNPSSWLSLEGRTDDIVTFKENGKKIKIVPLALYATLKEIHEILRFQVIVHEGNHLELRLINTRDSDKIGVYEKACEVLRSFLKTHAITTLTFSLSDEEPKAHPQSGKFKHIICTENI